MKTKINWEDYRSMKDYFWMIFCWDVIKDENYYSLLDDFRNSHFTEKDIKVSINKLKKIIDYDYKHYQSDRCDFVRIREEDMKDGYNFKKL